jgi:methionine-rich copper-binding protein CopC
MATVRAGLVVALGAVLLLQPAPGWGHAVLVKSSPARRAVLARAPAEVQLWFNERIEPRFAHVSVWNRGGERVDLGDGGVGPEPTRLSVRLRPLEPGTYLVKFRVLSVDGHVVEQQFSFTIRPSR